jgi:hypothetical protein
MNQFFASLQRKDVTMMSNISARMFLLRRLATLIARYAKCLIVGAMSANGLVTLKDI